MVVGGGGGTGSPYRPLPRSNHTMIINLTFGAGWFGLTILSGLNKIPKISFMAAFATSLLSILDPNTHSNPSLG